MKLTHDELIKHGYKLVFEDHFENGIDDNLWEKKDIKQAGHKDRICHRNPKNVF